MADKCGKCNHKVTKTNKGLQCEVCSVWYHAKCVEISDEMYVVLDNKALHWYCNECNGAASNLHKEIVLLRKKHQDLERRVFQLETDTVSRDEVKQLIQESVSEESRKMKEQLQEELPEKIKEQLPADLPEAGAQPKENDSLKMQKQMRELVTEFNEIGRRKENVIIHRLAENETDDKTKIAEIFKVINNNFKEEHIKSCKRLGEKENDADKPRSILVRLNNEEMVKDILSNAKKLKDTEHKISLTRDLPPQTRKYQEMLLREAREEKGEEAGNFLYRIVGKPGMEKIKSKAKPQTN